MSGVDITTELVKNVQEDGEFGWTGELCKHLKERDIDYKIKFIHLTPDMYPKYMENDKYNIGHLFWETDRLPKEWIAPCNKMQEIWTASEQQAKMIRDSGVTIPINWFPQPIDISEDFRSVKPYTIPGFTGVIFYSIFQWIDRKNPFALLRSFWKEFEGVKDVCLVIKTHGVNFSEGQFESIKKSISDWKAGLNLSNPPRVMLVKNLMNTEDMFRLHKTGNCLVCPSRGEGWCIPVAEALLTGNSVIGIDKTGIFDLLKKDEYLSCSTSVDKVMKAPAISWYYPPQQWLEISQPELQSNMRKVYESVKSNDSGYRDMILRGQRRVKEDFNYQSVGVMMLKRLKEIYEK